MKNKLTDLNDHLFAQLERLADENLTQEQLDREHQRGAAIVAVAGQIVRNATVQLQAARLVSERGEDPMLYLPQIEGRRRLIAGKNGQ